MLHVLNYYFLQWYFIRLAGVFDDATGKHVKWTIIRVIPLTGYHGIPMKKW